MTATNDLIAILVSQAEPVRRLRPPVLRALGWLVVAVAVIAVLGAWHGLRADLATRLGQSWFVAGLAAAALTGALAAVAAFQLSLPDRGRAWGLLPLPAVLVWLASVGVGCLTDWVRLDANNFQWGDAASCFGLLVVASVPLSVALFWMLRHTARLRPAPAILAGALAVAALSACALSLLHVFEASAMILLWNFGAAALVMGVDAMVGRRVLR